MTAGLLSDLTVFVLSVLVGIEVISKVHPRHRTHR